MDHEMEHNDHHHEPTATPAPVLAPDTHETGDEAPMVSLTAVAADKVKEIRTAEKIEDGFSLRMRVIGGGCSGFAYDLYFDQKAEGDREFNSNGVQLLVDQMSLMYLMGVSIDYVEGLQGAGFKFNNPNVKSTCGCGSSFSV
jgi:iron-sulfur cluster insertion protein